MATKTISFSLEVGSIDKAIAEVIAYRDEFQRKVDRLRQLVAERIAWSASRGFSTTLVSDVIFGSGNSSDVQVTVEDDGNVTTVIADGNEALFIEFGAGVFNNGPVGTSPHPWGTYTIGSYGKGNGAKNAWGYRNADGTITVTRGTPSAMPMYRGIQDAMNAFDSLVQEVFG